MFGLGGILNRRGWTRSDEPEWYAEWVDDAMEDHADETGCPGFGVDGFEDDEFLYCSYCGDPI